MILISLRENFSLHSHLNYNWLGGSVVGLFQRDRPQNDATKRCKLEKERKGSQTQSLVQFNSLQHLFETLSR